MKANDKVYVILHSWFGVEMREGSVVSTFKQFIAVNLINEDYFRRFNRLDVFSSKREASKELFKLKLQGGGVKPPGAFGDNE